MVIKYHVGSKTSHHSSVTQTGQLLMVIKYHVDSESSHHFCDTETQTGQLLMVIKYHVGSKSSHHFCDTDWTASHGYQVSCRLQVKSSLFCDTDWTTSHGDLTLPRQSQVVTPLWHRLDNFSCLSSITKTPSHNPSVTQTKPLLRVIKYHQDPASSHHLSACCRM